MDRSSLDDLAAFATVARLGSFTRAAGQIGTSVSNLSHTIRRLETRIGMRLLQRNSRSVAPTEAGEDLLATLGPALEHDPLFPERANIGFVEVLAPDRIRLRVWERGAGLTLACGSGACAALVNAHRRGLTERRATVLVDGGTLDIEWTEAGRVLMAGPAATSFHGIVAL